MAQATDGITFKNVKIESSTDGVSWTNQSGESNMVEIDGGDRDTADTFTADTDTPIVSTGKRKSIGVTITSIWRKVAGSLYALAKASYENDSLLYVRWSPEGGAGGTEVFTASGKVTAQPYPSGDAGSADLIMTKVKMQVSKITQSTL